jgi:hypothetical protein
MNEGSYIYADTSKWPRTVQRITLDELVCLGLDARLRTAATIGTLSLLAMGLKDLVELGAHLGFWR